MNRRLPGYHDDINPADYMDHPYEDCDPCPDPECDGVLVRQEEHNYGADRDGNRGITVHWIECNRCGEGPEE